MSVVSKCCLKHESFGFYDPKPFFFRNAAISKAIWILNPIQWVSIIFFSIDITCQRPILSIRGSLQLSTNPLQQTFSYNESISFFCTPGYILHGPTVKYCRQNGDFEQGLPFCTGTTRRNNVKFRRQDLNLFQ